MTDAPLPGAAPNPGPGPRLGKPRRSLRRRSIATAAWSMGGVGLQRSLSLASNLVMTRLLLPEAFGLMAIVTTVLMMGEMVSDIGVRQSVVRSERGEDLRFLRIAWTVQVVRSGAIALLVVLVAAAIWALGPALASPGSVYADPRLAPLVAAASGAVILRGMATTAIWRASRRLEVGANIVISVASQVISIVAMVLGALVFGATVWVLLLGMLFGSFVSLVMGHVVYRDAPMRPAWDREVTGEMWRFGRWIILSSMATFVAQSGDRFVLGALLDTETFGLYAVASIWLGTGLMVVDRLSGAVIFSTLAEVLRERRRDFPRLLARVRLLFDGVLLFFFVACLVLAGPVIGLLYTSEYAAAAPILALLSLRFLALRQRPLQMFLTAEGRSDVVAGATVLGAATMVAGVPLAWHLGGLGAAVIVVAMAPLAASPITFRAARRQMPGLPIRLDLLIVPAVVAAAVAVYLAVGHTVTAVGGGGAG